MSAGFERRPLHLITVIANLSRFPNGEIAPVLHARGIHGMILQAGRSFMLVNRRGIAAALTGPVGVMDWRVAVVSMLVAPECSDSLLGLLYETIGLDDAGNGSMYIESVEVLGKTDWAGSIDTVTQSHAAPRMSDGLAGICCIVQRGQSASIAQSALANAACVPHLVFGTGAGLRDKLGLLRITIPPEKGLVNMVVSATEASSVIAMLTQCGQLDLPGRGFVYQYPVARGLVNRRVRSRDTGHAASMDQIVAAIDELTGNARWRSSLQEPHCSPLYDGLMRNMVELNVQCDEGASERLVDAAMSAGAGGATLCEATALMHERDDTGGVSPARELCGMVLPRQVVEPVWQAMVQAGLYDASSHGVVLCRPVPSAFSYRASPANRR